jgi:AraC-like DNA-binding protein
LSGVVIHETGHLARNPDWNFPSMFSPYWRLIYDWRAGHKLVLPDREIMLGPERLVLNPDHFRCDFRGAAPVPTSWIHFTHDRRPTHAQEVPIVLTPTPVERGLLTELAGLFGAPAETGRRRIFSLSLALLQMVLSRPELHWLEERPEGLNRATQLIQAQFAEPLYNPALARKAGMSVRTFARLFRRHQGVSPARFIAQVRVRAAAHLLATTLLNMEEIAARAGFPNAAYLSRVFKQLTGETPQNFRQLHPAKPAPGKDLKRRQQS